VHFPAKVLLLSHQLVEPLAHIPKHWISLLLEAVTKELLFLMQLLTAMLMALSITPIKLLFFGMPIPPKFKAAIFQTMDSI
jgi:hypothetical protein